MHAFWKTLHLLGACLFLGNILVSAVWKVLADRSGDPAVIRFGSRLVNLTDGIFTGTGAALLAITGHLLAPAYGGVLANGWILTSYTLFGLSGLIWLAVLLPIQFKQARLLKGHATEVPADYFRLDRIWSVAGVIASLAPLPVLWLMVTKGS